MLSYKLKKAFYMIMWRKMFTYKDFKKKHDVNYMPVTTPRLAARD